MLDICLGLISRRRDSRGATWVTSSNSCYVRNFGNGKKSSVCGA